MNVSVVDSGEFPHLVEQLKTWFEEEWGNVGHVKG